MTPHPSSLFELPERRPTYRKMLSSRLGAISLVVWVTMCALWSLILRESLVEALARVVLVVLLCVVFTLSITAIEWRWRREKE